MLKKYIVLLLLFVPIVLSCGLTVHLHVSKQALQILQVVTNETNELVSLLHEHQSSLEAGSFFPDWGYNCGHSHEQSEYSHWPQFYVDAAALFRQQCSQLVKSLRCRRFASFLYGGVSHAIADISWHSLYSKHTGFITAMALHDFKHDYEKAHSAADVGGIFVLSSTIHSSDFSNVWKIPLADVLNIYKQSDLSVKASTFTRCMNVGMFGVQAVTHVGNSLYPLGAASSDFMSQNLFNYYHGGIHDMAASVAECWLDYQVMLASDVPLHKRFRNCPLFQEFDTLINKPIPKLLPNFNNFTSNIDTFETQESDKCLELIVYERMFTLRDEVSSVAYSNGIYAVGSPFYTSQTHGVHAGSVSLFISKVLLLKLYGSVPKGRFGHSIAFIDWNQDGIDDLVVSAPSSNYKEKMYCGKVYIYFWPYSKYANVTIDGCKGASDEMIQFGFTLSIGDLDGDGVQELIIGSPYAKNKNIVHSGLVSIFKVNHVREGVISWQDSWKTVARPNASEGELFGYSLSISNRYLFVGAPGYADSAGKVYVVDLVTEAVSHINPDDQTLRYFGQVIQMDDSVLYVGSSTNSEFSFKFKWPLNGWQKGSISKYKIDGGQFVLSERVFGSHSDSRLGTSFISRKTGIYALEKISVNKYRIKSLFHGSDEDCALVRNALGVELLSVGDYIFISFKSNNEWHISKVNLQNKLILQ